MKKIEIKDSYHKVHKEFSQSSQRFSLNFQQRLPHFSFFIFSLIISTSCSDVRRDQYVAEGYELFKANCANCHQEKGSGLEGLYPVIVKEYLVDNQTLACMIKNGMNQPIVVNGKSYSRPMPANLQLKDLEIAEIMTFLQNQYKVSEQITPTDSVVVWLQKCN